MFSKSLHGAVKHATGQLLAVHDVSAIRGHGVVNPRRLSHDQPLCGDNCNTSADQFSTGDPSSLLHQMPVERSSRVGMCGRCAVGLVPTLRFANKLYSRVSAMAPRELFSDLPYCLSLLAARPAALDSLMTWNRDRHLEVSQLAFYITATGRLAD